MSTLASVGVHDYLAAGKSGVAMRASDNEFARRIYEIFDIVIEQREHFFAELRLHSRHEDILHVSLNLLQHTCLVGIKVVVLRTYDDGVDALRDVVVGIFHRNLAL